MDTATPQQASPADATGIAATVIAGLSAVMAFGCLLMALAHAGLSLPLLSALGPGGDRVVVPAVVSFAVAGLGAAAVSVGALRRRPWAWALGLALNALILLGALMPYRGVVSLAGAVLALLTAGVLVSRAGREALLPRR